VKYVKYLVKKESIFKSLRKLKIIKEFKSKKNEFFYSLN
jgi:hypothetical protein